MVPSAHDSSGEPSTGTPVPIRRERRVLETCEPSTGTPVNVGNAEFWQHASRRPERRSYVGNARGPGQAAEKSVINKGLRVCRGGGREAPEGARARPKRGRAFGRVPRRSGECPGARASARALGRAIGRSRRAPKRPAGRSGAQAHDLRDVARRLGQERRGERGALGLGRAAARERRPAFGRSGRAREGHREAVREAVVEGPGGPARQLAAEPFLVVGEDVFGRRERVFAELQPIKRPER